MSQPNESAGSTRREFIQKTAVTSAVAGVAAAGVMPTTAEAMRRVRGANDRIKVGHVGLGVQGRGAHLRLIHDNAADNNVQQIALCDLYGWNLTESQKIIGVPDSARYTDYRKFMENKDIDAVVVATSDNWHCDVALAALEAGKSVYCEKPMCKTVEEAFKLYDAVKKSGKTFQVGSQGCTDNKWHIAGKLVREGKIGKLIVAQGSYMRGDNKQGEWNNYGRFDLNASPTAKGDDHVDWETFRKGKYTKDFDPDIFFHWRKYWGIGSGLVGDLFPHRLHPLFIAMGLPTDGYKGFPLRVSSGGGQYVQKKYPTDTPEQKAYLAKYHPGKAEYADREVPDFVNLNVDFEDCSLMAMTSSVNEQGWPDTVRGNKATLYIGGNTVEIKPERTWADEIDGETETNNGLGEDIAAHEKNWFDCIRTNGVPNANIDLAVRVQVMVTLAEMSFRQNKTFTFNPQTRKYSGA